MRKAVRKVPNLQLLQGKFQAVWQQEPALLSCLCFLILQKAIGLDPHRKGNNPGNGKQGRNIVVLTEVENSAGCTDGHDDQEINKGRNRFHFVRFRYTEK